jgi:NADPH-dependent 2,4-dienoyl-CoA reductase/sulfur reductase-like enzyme
MPLRSEKFFSNRDITVRLATPVKALDKERQLVRFEDGSELEYGALLLATGAEPVHLPLPGAELSHVFYLRTLDDARAIIEKTNTGAKRAVVLGASFIGLEVAASLRARDLEVHVIAPEALPMARIMGDTLGQFVQNLHETKGVVFHLEQTATAITSDSVTLENGEQIQADLVVIGVGVKPNLTLAEACGLKIDRGVVVDAYLQTSAPNVYAAGDIARWPDPHSGQSIRVEHWTVAQRQGQTAARNMLGAMEKFTDVPFFWSQHYNATINYSGHAESWDRIETDGDPAKYDFSARFIKDGKTLALATIYRDLESLQYEAEMERQQKSSTKGESDN